MRLKDIKRTLAVLLAAVITLSLSGCGEIAPLFTELPASDVMKWETNDPIQLSDDMLGLDKMKQVADKDGLTLLINEKTTEIAVKSENGTVWFSNPQNRLDMNESLIGRYSSPLLVTAIDSAETSKQMNAFDDCVKNGQFTIQSISNGVRVEYHFGRVVKTPLYPQVLTADRFNELIAGLEKNEQNNMKRYYLEVNYDTVQDEQALKNLQSLYTKIKEIKHIYVLKQSPSALEIRRINEYFTKLEYTMEMRSKDQDAVGYTDVDKARGNFIIPVEYQLASGKLNVRIPVEEIKATDNIKLDTVTLLPYMNTAAGLNDSQAVLPDGSGAVVELSKIRSGGTPDYDEGFYGVDYSLYQKNMTSQKKNLYLPVYGVTTPTGSMLAVVQKADCTSSVYASARVSEQDMGAIGAKFKLLDYAKVLLTSNDTETVNSYPDKSIQDEIAVDFTFMSGHQWTDIATTYRQNLTKKKGFGGKSGNNIDQAPLLVNLIGAIDDKQPIMGFPREVIVPLTTFKQAEEIIGKLNNMFPNIPLIIRYSGWRKGGLKSSVLNRFDAERKLGGNKGLLSLVDSMSGMNAKLLPDADFQYVYRDILFDGFSASNDVVRFITREAAFKPQYNKANFMPEENGLNGYIYPPNLMPQNADRFLKAVKDKKISGFSLPFIASDLAGNFDKNNYLTRNESKAYSVELLKKLRDEGYEIMSGGANAYTLPYLSYAVNIPTESNPHPLIDRSIPFTQMVLSGVVKYGAGELNTATDDSYYLLKCIETGSAMYFTAIYEDNSVLKGTNYSDFYNVSFAQLEKRVEDIGKQLSAALEPVYGSKITKYSELSDGVIRVDYTNGKGIIVNYNQSDVTTEAGIVPAAGWLHVEGR
jgi:hypothetical protein